MNGMINRVSGWVKRVATGYRQDRTISGELARINVGLAFCGKLRLTKLTSRLLGKKNALILSRLSDIVSDSIETFRNNNDHGESAENAPIWVCWWQDLGSAPKLVQNCVRSIRNNAGNHPVHLIHEGNFREYLSIPEAMLEKVRTKKICLANFSDYLRFSLLNRYGGLWIDATIFVSQRIPEECFLLPLYTCNSECRSTFITDGRWTAFLYGGRRGHTLFRFMQSALEEYWLKMDSAIDYLLVDYLIRTAYDAIACVREDIDAVPINNLRRNNLRAAMNRAEPAERFHQFLYQDTCFNKLSWREPYRLTAQDGKPTVYAAFLNLYEE